MKFFFVAVTTFFLGPFAQAGATYQIYKTVHVPELEFCHDKFGMNVSRLGRPYEEMNFSPPDSYLSKDKATIVVGHANDYGYDLIIKDNERHTLTRANTSFGSCYDRDAFQR